MNIHRVFVIGLLFTLLAGCIAEQPLQRRWANAIPPTIQPLDPHGTGAPISPGPAHIPADGAPTLHVSSLPADAAAATSIKDLLDHAAAAYLTQIGRFSKSLSDFRAAASKPVRGRSDAIDLSSIDRTLVVTVAKSDYRPADRLIRTRIELVPRNFSFANYTVAATAYTTVNIETVGSSVSASNSSVLDPTFHGLLVGTGILNASKTTTNTDTAAISQQVEQLTSYVENGNLVLYRESERGLDLTGNTLVKLSLQAKEADVDERYLVSATNLIDDNGNPLPKEKASITLSFSRLLKEQHDYTMDAKFEYIVRRVDAKDAATYDESDDSVQLVSDAMSCHFAVVSAKEVSVPRWLVETESGRPLLIGGYSGSNAASGTQLEFTDFQAAQQLVHWLAARSATSVGGQELRLEGPLESLAKVGKPYPTFRLKRVNDKTNAAERSEPCGRT